MGRRVGFVRLVLVAAVLGSVLVPVGSAGVRGESPPDHLVISEIVTGGASASDEFVEIYNPTAGFLPLEGLELVYVSASGATVSRRAAWDAGAPGLGPGRHLLVANELGSYAGIGDARYAAGMAASGGSVALRIQGASSAIDAVGWGTAASTWLEGTPAAAPATGASLERLPGGVLGSTRDTDDNAGDFVERGVPDPQNLSSPPTPDPSASPTPTPSIGPTPSPTPPTPTPTPGPTTTPSATPDAAVSVATARTLVDGSAATIEAIALTGSTFTDGGGYVADATGGIAVLLSSGAFERGSVLRITGTVDDRFSQRTLRADASGVTVLGSGADPEPLARSTGTVEEAVEGRLVRAAGSLVGSPTSLSAGLAYDLDDGSGVVRVVVGSTTGIDTTAWTAGKQVELVGVVGQRDSSGTGSAGYRLQPRDSADVVTVQAPSPSPSATASAPSGQPDPSASPLPDGVVSIADARKLPKNARVRVRGTVTLAPGVIDPVSAVIQDASGAILLRIADEVGGLVRGERVEVSGTRSTLAGMETLRVTAPAVRLGSAAEPAAATVRTGDAGERLEARLVNVRGAIVSTARRVASGTVSFELDDGSGPLRVYLAASLAADATGFVTGAWVEATGVLGQETTGAQPLRGYRVWPRTAAEVRIGAAPTASSAPGAAASVAGGGDGTGDDPGSGSASLTAIDEAELADLHVAATLVHGPWPELGVGGLLWDGARLAAVDPDSEPGVAAVLGNGPPPLPLQLTGLATHGTEPETGVTVVVLGTAPGDVSVRDGTPDAPSTRLPESGAAWVTFTGRLAGDDERLVLQVDDATVEIAWRCDDPDAPRARTVRVTGIGLPDPARVLVPCGGLQPAPSLGRAVALAGATEPRGPEPASPADRVAAAGTGGLQPVAAGLLLLGALLVAGAGLLARRLDPDPAPEGAAAADEAQLSDASDDAAPPVLSLVSVPHERGSP